MSKLGYSNKKKKILNAGYDDSEETDLIKDIEKDFTIREWNSLSKEEKQAYLKGDDENE